MNRGTALKVLAIIYATNGLMSLAGALAPMSDRTPVRLLETLAAIGVVGATVLTVARRSPRAWMVHTGLAVLTVCVALLAWRSATTVGVIGLGPTMVCIGLFAAYFLPLPQARAHLWPALVITTTAAVFSAAPPLPVQAWVVSVVAVILVVEVQGRLAGSLNRAASTDALTGLLNRRAWLVATDRDVAAAERRGHSGPTVVIIDLDGFKQVNDELGHAGGDRLLRELATAWSALLRRSDVLARYGGDEFALLLADGSGAESLLDRMRAAHEGRWTAGIGRWRPGDTTDAMVLRADDELYHLKHRRPHVATVATAHSTSLDTAREAG